LYKLFFSEVAGSKIISTFAVPILSLFAEVLIGYCNNLSKCYQQLIVNNTVTITVDLVNQQKWIVSHLKI
jgi:hypothetical protein